LSLLQAIDTRLLRRSIKDIEYFIYSEDKSGVNSSGVWHEGKVGLSLALIEESYTPATICGVIAHELIHGSTEAEDCTRKFENGLTEAIGRLINRLGKTDITSQRITEELILDLREDIDDQREIGTKDLLELLDENFDDFYVPKSMLTRNRDSTWQYIGGGNPSNDRELFYFSCAQNRSWVLSIEIKHLKARSKASIQKLAGARGKQLFIHEVDGIVCDDLSEHELFEPLSRLRTAACTLSVDSEGF